ncbi:MAG TPA: thiamine ABC transporter substrate binding subunit [Rhizobiales bacterium]|nr:thiamine ABC transporter substrate binding subunit [Hyphomicrobiales bacterium]
MRKLLMIMMLVMISALPGRAGPVLTIYTYDSFTASWGPGPLVKKSFEAECGCKVKWVALADGVALLNRLKLEGANTSADIVLGLDTNVVADARESGFFEAAGIDVPDGPVSDKWRDDTFIAYDYAPFAVIYDTQTIKNPPRSLDELVNGPADQKIILQDPRTSTPGLGFLMWMKSVYGNKAGKAWEKLSRRVLTVTPGWSAAYSLFTKGEAPMVLSYVTSPAYHMIVEKTDRYRAALFSEGHYLQIEVAALVAASKNKALARRFLAFMTGPGFQDHIATTNWMFPAGKTSKPLPKEFDRLIHPAKLWLKSPGGIRQHRREWIDEWLKAMSR